MKTFLSFVATIVLGVAALWALVAFLQWDESERDNALIQLLPYELNYTYQAEAQDYRDGNGWYARLYTRGDDGRWQECHNHMISLDDYEKLKSLSDQTPAGLRSFVVARQFNTKSTGSLQCEVAVGDWDKFLTMKQPTEAMVRQFNRIKREEQIEAASL